MTDSARIASLETQVRTLKRMLFGVFGLVVAGAVLGATSLQTVPDVITAKQFTVVNDKGDHVIHLGSHPVQKRGVAYFVDPIKGGQVVRISSNEAGGNISLLNGKGGQTVYFNSNVYGGGVSINEPNGNIVLMMASTPHGGSLTACDPRGKLKTAIGCLTSDSGSAMFWNKDNKGTVRISSNDEGHGLVDVSDKNEENIRTITYKAEAR